MAQDVDEVVRRIAELAGNSAGLAVVSTVSAGGAPQSSVVNAGPLPHPVTGEPHVALVAMGGSVKLRNLGRDPRATVVFRDGHRWTTVEGRVTLIGPDHPHPGVDPGDVPGLLRAAYRIAGGGEHPDWAEFDTVMAEDRRALVLVAIDRSYGVYWPAGEAPAR